MTMTAKQIYMKAYYAKHGVRLREMERQRRLVDVELSRLKDRQNYQRNRLQKLNSKKLYHINNRQKRNAYSRSYWASNRNKLTANCRKRYLANRKQAIKNSTDYIRANPEKHKLYRNRWRKRNPEKWQAGEARRRALEKGVATDKKSVQWFFTAIRNQHSVTCSYCQASIDALKAHVDHIVPISCGGDDLPDNFAVSCPSCNLSKHDHLLHEWKRCPERIRRLWLEYFSKHAVALNMR